MSKGSHIKGDGGSHTGEPPAVDREAIAQVIVTTLNAQDYNRTGIVFRCETDVGGYKDSFMGTGNQVRFQAGYIVSAVNGEGKPVLPQKIETALLSALGKARIHSGQAYQQEEGVWINNTTAQKLAEIVTPPNHLLTPRTREMRHMAEASSQDDSPRGAFLQDFFDAMNSLTRTHGRAGNSSAIGR